MATLRKLVWVIRLSAREAPADVGRLWAAIPATILIAAIPIAAIAGFTWDQGTKIALVTAIISYPILYGFAVAQRAVETLRAGHKYFRTQIDVATDQTFNVWLMLKPGASPQGVNDLGLLVRRRGEEGYGVCVPGQRTIDNVGPMPPHLTYPTAFPSAPTTVEEGTYQIIWSDVRGGKRREFLYHEQEIWF